MRLLALISLFSLAAAAQVGDGLIVGVNRTLSLTPDQAEFMAVVTTGLDATQSEVIQVFRKAGIQNLTVVTVAAGPNSSQYPPPPASQVYYGISFTVDPGDFKDFAKRLDAMKANPSAPITSLQFSALLTASAAAVETAHQSALPSLVAEARSKAQALAQAAGLKAGAIQGLSESSYALQGVAYGVLLPGIVSGSFASSSSGNTQYVFYASVKFAVQ